MNGMGSTARRAAMIVVPFVFLALLWQFTAAFMPPFLFPSLPQIFWRAIDILLSWKQVCDVLATVSRIMAGLAGAFVLGAVFAAFMMKSSPVDKFVAPILNFFQGIPALSWVVFAIIWFKGTEFRIFFIMVATTLPAFTFQILDALRGMPKDLIEMVQSFRPTRRKMFQTMVTPAILPEIMTAWKVNLGNASRVVVVAELVGATDGIGYQLMQQQQLFDMAGAIAWTLQIVVFVIVMQNVIRSSRRTCSATARSRSVRYDRRRAAPDVEIRFDHVSKTFARDARNPTDVFRAVDDVTLDVHKGEIVALLGKTGCGKSTMFNMIAGLIDPSAGAVLVSGKDPFRNFDWFRGKIAVVFQNDRLLPWRTAIGNVELGLEMLDMPKPTRRDIAQRWLTRLGLDGHENDYPHALSGGMRQRVSIARAFATDASLLLCDEPFSALDEMTGQKLREEFVTLVRENDKTAVFITHSIEEALQLGDRIVTLQRPAKIAYEVRIRKDMTAAERDDVRSRIPRRAVGLSGQAF